jgi:hypothetical protein
MSIWGILSTPCLTIGKHRVCDSRRDRKSSGTGLADLPIVFFDLDLPSGKRELET